MAYTWLRFYYSARHSRKVNALSPSAFRVWVMCLTLAGENDGKITKDIGDLGYELHLKPSRAAHFIQDILKIGLLVDKGTHYETPDWHERQYKSDSSTERTKRYRERHTNVTVTPQTQIQTQTQITTESGTTTEPSIDRPLSTSKAAPLFLVKKTDLPDWLPKEAWEGFADMRRKIRAPLTERATKLTITALEKLRGDGYDPAEVLDQSTQNSWRGVFPPKGRIDGKKSTATDKHLAAIASLISGGSAG